VDAELTDQEKVFLVMGTWETENLAVEVLAVVQEVESPEVEILEVEILEDVGDAEMVETIFYVEEDSLYHNWASPTNGIYPTTEYP
jgi:hypothetical protein